MRIVYMHVLFVLLTANRHSIILLLVHATPFGARNCVQRVFVDLHLSMQLLLLQIRRELKIAAFLRKLISKYIGFYKVIAQISWCTLSLWCSA